MTNFIAKTPAETFAIGETIGASLSGGEVLLLYGGLGAGKTLLTKGIMNALDYDIDEVTSPSFALVNLYKSVDLNVYHIDLWRLETVQDPAEAVGLSEILDEEKSVAIIEWADRLRADLLPPGAITVLIEGDGDQERTIRITGGS